MTPHAARVVVGNLSFQALMEIWIASEIVKEPNHCPRIQRAADTIFEITIEAMGRGMYSGCVILARENVVQKRKAKRLTGIL